MPFLKNILMHLFRKTLQFRSALINCWRADYRALPAVHRFFQEARRPIRAASPVGEDNWRWQHEFVQCWLMRNNGTSVAEEAPCFLLSLPFP
eukprot:990384-Pelagomonas_calceolata.AAC.2